MFHSICSSENCMLHCQIRHKHCCSSPHRNRPQQRTYTYIYIYTKCIMRRIESYGNYIRVRGSGKRVNTRTHTQSQYLTYRADKIFFYIILACNICKINHFNICYESITKICIQIKLFIFLLIFQNKWTVLCYLYVEIGSDSSVYFNEEAQSYNVMFIPYHTLACYFVKLYISG